MMFNKIVTLVVLPGALIALWSVPAGARQEGPAQEQMAPGADLSPVEIQRLFDAYTVVQAQEMLNLDDGRYGQFVARLKTLQEVRRRNQQERQRRLQELTRLTNRQAAIADEATIRERLTALQDHDVRAAADLRKAYDAVDQVLDIRQQARFRVFEDQMERRKFQLLMRARQVNRLNQRQQNRPQQ